MPFSNNGKKNALAAILFLAIILIIAGLWYFGPGSVNFSNRTTSSPAQLSGNSVAASLPPKPCSGSGDCQFGPSADNTSQCGQISVSWSDGSGGGAIDQYEVFRNQSGSGPASGDLIKIIPLVSGQKIYTYNDNSTIAGQVYYYWVRADGEGVQSAFAGTGAYSSRACAGLPVTFESNANIIAINGSPVASADPCDAVTNQLPANLVLRQGDLLVFELNLCNTGTATATLASLTDSMTNLQMPNSGWDVKFYDSSGNQIKVAASAAGSPSLKTLTFSGVLGQKIGVPTSGQPVYVYLTYQARLEDPFKSAGSVSHFANSFSFNYLYNGGKSSSASGNFSTGYVPFYIPSP